MVCVEILSDGLKTTYKIVIRLSKLVTLYLAVRLNDEAEGFGYEISDFSSSKEIEFES